MNQRWLALVAAVLWTGLGGSASTPRSRLALLVDSSGAMLLTPDAVDFATLETCAAQGFDPCSFSGNPSPAQETCNACVRDTVNFLPSCATSWSGTCRAQYGGCVRNVTGSTTCRPVLGLTGGLDTRGDGSAELGGCDVDGNAQPDDSRLFQTKRALSSLFSAHPEVEFALWRHAQVQGGQACTLDAECPDTPGGRSLLTCELVDGTSLCALDAANLGISPTTAGQCLRQSFNGAPSSFSCSLCNFSSSWERAICEAYGLDRVRTGGVSLLEGSTVDCAYPTPQHPFMRDHGAVRTAGICDPAGAQRLVDYPAPGVPDNLAALLAWIDHVQAPFATAPELRAHGLRPIAASLRDMRPALLASLSGDLDSPCRPYHVVVIAAGAEECETAADAESAAAALQDLSFTSGSGIPVTGFDVPVHVLGFGICPPTDPACPAAQQLHALAAAGGTGAAVLVGDEAGLLAALDQFAASAAPPEEVCDGMDNDCDGTVDNAQAPSGSPDLFVDATLLSWSALPGATGYDVVRGSLETLRTSGGDFSSAVVTCSGDDLPATSVENLDAPAPAQGLFYLVRGVNCGGAGTYDAAGSSQAQPRDAEIEASASSCP
ncbi:MAG TPA: hypothetical protein VFV75_18540 [Candidatus Polarisedimenticolaceae bacterium]|nr:hypothetical protein [Candidatus Polarisedimenticolaceae bacterium]